MEEEKIKELAGSYRVKVIIANGILSESTDVSQKQRLLLKIGCYKTFISELEKIINP